MSRLVPGPAVQNPVDAADAVVIVDPSSGVPRGSSANPLYVQAPTGASADAVQGPAADGAAVVGNPVRIGGKDGSGNTQDVVTDTTGRLLAVGAGTAGTPAGGVLTVQGDAGASPLPVGGSVAAGATDSGNPLKVGAKYNLTLPTYTDGQRGDAQINARGLLRVVIFDDAQGSAFTRNVPSADAANLGGQVGLQVGSANYAFNASTWDRLRSVAGAANTTGAGVLATGLPLLSATDLTQLRITNAGASGDTTLVSATASQTTRVYRMRLSAAGATTVQIKDGSTVLEVFNFGAAGDSVVLNLSDRPYYKTTANTALVLNSSAAVQVDGMLEYVKSA